MAPTTRGDNARALQHLLTEILETEPTDPLVLALAQNGVTKLTNLLVLTEEDVRGLTYVQPTTEITLPLLKAQTKELFQALQYYNSLPGPNQLLDWLQVTPDSFASWIAGPPTAAGIVGNEEEPTPPQFLPQHLPLHQL